MTIEAVRLNHAVLFVADLERSITFYEQAFGIEIVAREPRANAAFLRLPRSGNHHDLGLFGVGAQPPGPAARSASTTSRGSSTPIDELAQARADPDRAGAYTGESSHGATKSIYGARPRRQRVRGHVDAAPRRAGATFENAAPIDRLDLAGEVRRWSGVRTAAELVPWTPGAS